MSLLTGGEHAKSCRGDDLKLSHTECNIKIREPPVIGTPLNLIIRNSSLKFAFKPPREEFFGWIPDRESGGRGPPLKNNPQNWCGVLWVSLFGNHPTNPNVLGIPTISIPGWGVSDNQIIEKLLKKNIHDFFLKKALSKIIKERLVTKAFQKKRYVFQESPSRKKERKKSPWYFFFKSQNAKILSLIAHHSWVTVSRPLFTSGLRCGVVIHSCRENKESRVKIRPSKRKNPASSQRNKSDLRENYLRKPVRKQRQKLRVVEKILSNGDLVSNLLHLCVNYKRLHPPDTP